MSGALNLARCGATFERSSRTAGQPQPQSFRLLGKIADGRERIAHHGPGDVPPRSLISGPIGARRLIWPASSVCSGGSRVWLGIAVAASDSTSWATLRIPCAAASWLAIDAERSPNLPRRCRGHFALEILRGVAPRPDVVNIRGRRRVAEKCHYHHRHGHRNDSG